VEQLLAVCFMPLAKNLFCEISKKRGDVKRAMAIADKAIAIALFSWVDFSAISRL
jgi:hypothetical protein